MKYSINIRWLLLLFIIVMSSNSFAQGIRKDYTEMTNDERDALISAYWVLGNDINQNGPVGGLVGEIGDFHDEHFNENEVPDPIHFASDPSLDVFLAWHRQSSVELQRAMKNIFNNEWITIPYWDWTFSNSKSDALWGSNWLGPFDTAWGLNRSIVDNGGAPTQSSIDIALTETDFYPFSRWALESNNIHVWGHSWTGGTMGSQDSPKDPVFFFHHNMVDKIWAEWYEMYGDCLGGCYIKTDMPRYDLTHTNELGWELPPVDPDDIVDPRTLGIFYSDRVNSLTTLDKYTVSNDATSSEKFGYQYKIEAKDNFLVPAAKNAEFRSCQVIELLPGFEATNGAVFEARIDNDCNFSTSALVADNGDETGQTEERLIADELTSFKNSPNPFTEQTTIEFALASDSPVTLFISDVTGKKIAVLLNGELIPEGTHQVTFEAHPYPAGMYYYTIQAGGYTGTQRMIIAK